MKIYKGLEIKFSLSEFFDCKAMPQIYKPGSLGVNAIVMKNPQSLKYLYITRSVFHVKGCSILSISIHHT
jgi:hypothetical protein